MGRKITWIVGSLLLLTIVVSGIGMAVRDGVKQFNVKMKDERQSAEPKFAWSFQNVGTDETAQAPVTTVTLRIDGVAHDAGTYVGDCFVIDESEWQYQDNEVTGVICWWAGDGTEVGVFRENGALTVNVGELHEGSAEIPEFRGDFQTLFEI